MVGGGKQTHIEQGNLEGKMKLLRLRDKLINWDLVTDITISENSRGVKTMYVKFGSHKLRLDASETLGLENWMERNHDIEDIQLIQPRYKSPDQIIREKERERQSS